MKKLLSFAAVGIAMMLFVAPTAFAAEFIAPDEESGNITLSSGETHRNVYVAGSTIFINSDIAGDFYGAGGTIIIESAIEDDLVIAAGTVTLNGKVGGDIRIGGGEVTINGEVTGDIIVGAGTLLITEKASVGGDLYAAGGDLTVDAPVKGAVKIDGATVKLNSNMPGKVEVMASESFIIGSKAVIPNTITYKGNNDRIIQDGAQIGGVDFEKMEQHGNKAGRMVATLFTITFVIKIIALILAGLLLMKLFPRTTIKSVESMQRGMWTNLGIGLLGLIVAPIAFFILLVSFVGMYIGFLLLFVWLIMLLVAALVASVFAGAWIVKLLTKKGEMKYDWQSLVIGVVALGILMIIPVIGCLIFFILMLMAFGGIIRQFHEYIKSEQQDVAQFNQPTPTDNPIV